MRVVFMGTPDFAVPSLELLAARHEVVAVLSRPDAVSGRGGTMRPSPVSARAIEMDIPVLRPRTLRDAEVQSQVRRLAPEVIVVAAYGLILPPEVLGIAPLGAVNVHASLLPRWRGAAPIQRAILAGDERTGVSIMRMEEGLDTGPYCLQVAASIGEATADELTSELAGLGATALVEALPDIANGTAQWVAQDDTLVTYAEKISKADVAVAPSLRAIDAVRRICASSAAAPSRCTVAGRNVTLLRAGLATADVATGRVGITKSTILLGTSEGTFEVSVLKPEGKAEMNAAAWARGVRDIDESSWEALT